MDDMRRLVVVATLCLSGLALSQRPNAPAMPGQISPQQQAAATATLKKLEKDYATAKAAYAKKPKDKGAREHYITAGTKFGHESMVSPILSARVKYRQALRIYREVLKLDPKNPVAKPESDLIIRIYKSMGRPVPK